MACALVLCVSSSVATTTAFVTRHQLQRGSSVRVVSAKKHKSEPEPATPPPAATPTPADNAAAITDFMAKAHEEKIKAMARVEDKYKGQIAELQNKITELETQNQQTTPTSGNSFAFPATNKDLTDKVQAYRSFISDYIVKAQDEKAKAVRFAESKLTAKYEAIINELKADK
eukprot:jgi/Psemu1/296492/fgenesh1_pm.166_\